MEHKDIKKLGFGLMRLPKKDGRIDVEETSQMVDEFLDNGFTYFDTAYVYDNGESEEVIKKALVDRYPRDSYQLATKMNAWFGEPSAEEVKKQVETSLERTGAGYFDYYLLHALMTQNYKLYEEYGLWDLLKELKDQGVIKNLGFSYHSGPELLDEILTDHPEVDFVQLQINYADWDSPDIAARENYEVVRKHNKPLVIMEPVKGGTLATPIEEVEEIFKTAEPDSSMASWAIRFAADLPGVLTVLSGMSNLEQMQDNVAVMKDFNGLSEEQQKVIDKVREVYNNLETIPCTACHYCVENCPQNIPIPEIFKARNKQIAFGLEDEGFKEYEQAVEDKGRASDCIECLQCESACPQGLGVTTFLKECAEIFDNR